MGMRWSRPNPLNSAATTQYSNGRNTELSPMVLTCLRFQGNNNGHTRYRILPKTFIVARMSTSRPVDPMHQCVAPHWSHFPRPTLAKTASAAHSISCTLTCTRRRHVENHPSTDSGVIFSISAMMVVIVVVVGVGKGHLRRNCVCCCLSRPHPTYAIKGLQARRKWDSHHWLHHQPAGGG